MADRRAEAESKVVVDVGDRVEYVWVRADAINNNNVQTGGGSPYH